MNLYFSDVFKVRPSTIERYGAFNISLVSDLPLFIDPFLLFNSTKRRYRKLHDQIIDYLAFLRDKSVMHDTHSEGLLKAWYHFPEVRQTWLGFTRTGNSGSGLGRKFALALHSNLHKIFTNFGNERITRASHLEKLCLIQDGVGRDNISDFTANLIRNFLLEYTQTFAVRHISAEQRRVVSVPKVTFNYDTEVWEPKSFDLPHYAGEYVLLTPTDMLTKDDTWINKTDLLREFDEIPDAIPNEQLRAQINNYFLKKIPARRRDEPTKKDRTKAAFATLQKFPELIDFFIKHKEDNGDRAVRVSQEKIAQSKQLYFQQFRQLVEMLEHKSTFYDVSGSTYDECHVRIKFLKDVIENKGGHKIFYLNGRARLREEDVHVLYRLTWYATPSDVSREVNDGRGPADFKISRGSADKTIVEFKLARNSKLKSNLLKQVPIYKEASDAANALKVIIYFTKKEERRVQEILKELKLDKDRDIILIDARKDNKPSASKA